MSIFDDIVMAKFLANADQVQHLAREHVSANATLTIAGKTYLGILIATVQRRVSRRHVDPVQALDSVHADLYKQVLVGVDGPGLDRAEVNRRAVFARTAASELRRYLAAGLPLQDLVPGVTSKLQLRKSIGPPEPSERRERSLTRAVKTIVNTIKRIARQDREQAIEELSKLIETLRSEQDELENEDDEVEIMSHHVSRVSPLEERPRP